MSPISYSLSRILYFVIYHLVFVKEFDHIKIINQYRIVVRRILSYGNTVLFRDPFVVPESLISKSLPPLVSLPPRARNICMCWQCAKEGNAKASQNTCFQIRLWKYVVSKEAGLHNRTNLCVFCQFCVGVNRWGGEAATNAFYMSLQHQLTRP